MYKCLCCFICFLLSSAALKAQLTVGFTTDKAAGCSPLTVTFTNTTKGADARAVYTWNFGNGNSLTTSDARTPVAAIYYTPKTYKVTLTVRDGGRTIVTTGKVTLYENPTVRFSLTPPSGCAPLIATLTSSSLAGSGTLAQYFWDFGDGKTLQSVLASARDTFTLAGAYSPSLTVTNSHGCSSTLSLPNALTVFSAPVAAFRAASTRLCQVSDTARFVNTSTGAVGYQWTFGDGSGSTVPNPLHRYAAPGNYTVTLIAINGGGCADTVVQQNYIHVAQFSPAFSISSGSLCTGAAVQFINTGTPPPAGSGLWSFGDGASASGSTVRHVYTAPGTYTVSLRDTLGGCAAGNSQSVTINPGPVLGGFVVSQNAVCQAPVLVHFTDTSQGGVRWLWNFTGLAGDTSTRQDPAFEYPVSQVYQATLTVANAYGCSTTVRQAVYPGGKAAGIQVQQSLTPSDSVCANVTAACSAVTSDSIAQYRWTFGDGATATTARPSHTYSTPGTYTILLAYVTVHGCTGTAGPDTVRVYPRPVAAFWAQDTSRCGSGDDELFHNLSDSAGVFTWVFGDGSTTASADSTVAHRYPRAGTDTVLLIASSPGCAPDTAVQVVNVTGTQAPRGSVRYTCAGNRDTVTMTDPVTGGGDYVWTWGDGTVDTSSVYIPERTHVYARGGAYQATITATFGACTQTTPPIPVYVLSRQHPLLASPDTALCGSSPLDVTLTRLDTNYLGLDTARGGYGYALYQWQYAGGDSAASTAATGRIKTSYAGVVNNLQAGHDSLRVLLTSVGYGCADTSNYIRVRISGPRAAFSINTTDACSHGPVVFTDASTGTGGVSLVQWTWQFGDSARDVRSTGDTVMHVYKRPGTFVPTLTVKDADGCTQTVTAANPDSLVVPAPIADFYWSPRNIVPGVPVTFYNTSQAVAGTTYAWTFFSDGFTSTAPDSLRHTYGDITRDTVRLVAKPPAGQPCADTSIQVVAVTGVSAAFSDSTAYLSFNGCPPMVAYFTDTTTNAVRIRWDFGDGATAGNNPNPSHTYYAPGVYMVVLTAYGAGGDSSQVRDSILVNGPRATPHSSLTAACSPAVDTLSARAYGVTTYTWDFGDGIVSVTQDSVAVHRYAVAGIYAPALLVSDAGGCQAVFHLNAPVVVDTLYLQPLVSMTKCDTGTIAFTPVISSLVADSLGETLQYQWDFGTGRAGDTAATQNASYDFSREGAYPVGLRVLSPAGCSAVSTDTIRVAAPLALIYPPHTDICTGGSAPLQIEGQAINAYEWLPDSTLTVLGRTTALATPAVTTTYENVVTGLYHCYTDTVQMEVTVHPLPTVKIANPPPASPGTAVTLEATTSPDVVTEFWSPATGLSCTGCAAPVSTPLYQTTYVDSVVTAYGCAATGTVTVTLACAAGSVRIPNGFTPNGDGHNDRFMPVGRGVKVVRHFQVYSRWGDLVYSAEDLPIGEQQTGIGWDGTSRGREMPPGTYVYVMEFECQTGETFTEKGTVELIR